MARQESEFQLAQPDGTTKIYTLVPFITVDDLMELGMQHIAAEFKFGTDYETPASRPARDQLILTRVTTRS